MREAQRFPGVWRLETGPSRKKKRVETAKRQEKEAGRKKPVFRLQTQK